MFDSNLLAQARRQRYHISFVIDGEMKQALGNALKSAQARPLSGRISQSGYLRQVLVEHLSVLALSKVRNPEVAK